MVKLVCVIIVLALKSGITLPQGAKSVEVKLSNLLNDKPASSQPNGTINKQEQYVYRYGFYQVVEDTSDLTLVERGFVVWICISTGQ